MGWNNDMTSQTPSAKGISIGKWTHFWDMHSGGGQKEKWGHIFIEAPEDEAKIIFYNRFGHNPERVTCTCCGDDYSISEGEDLLQITGYHRNCQSLETPRDTKTGLYKNDDPVIRRKLYLEQGEKVPKGYKLSDHKPWGKYMTLEEFEKSGECLIIRANQIKPQEREGSVPEQGYVWHD